MALLQVKGVLLDDSQQNKLAALRQAATQCKLTIDNFWKKAQKYQPHLQSNGSDSRIKDGWMKITWAIFRKDDVAKFKADLVCHTESIQLLLATIQIASTNTAKEKEDQHYQTLLAKLQSAYVECMQRLLMISNCVSESLYQGKQLLQITSQIFPAVVAIQNMLTKLPSQVERQQPVYLNDALGKHSPFHLEFVRSVEALTAVIKINFKILGKEAISKIERGRFAIQDSATKRVINLTSNWDTCFYPGQRVEMSFIFTECGHHSPALCPKCETDCTCAVNSYVECRGCGMNFCRIEDAELKLIKDASEAQIRQVGRPIEVVGCPISEFPNRKGLQLLEDKMKRGIRQESVGLLDLVRRAMIIIPPLKYKAAPYTPASQLSAEVSSIRNQSTALGLGIDETEICTSESIADKLEKAREESPLSHYAPPPQKPLSSCLWTCCECGESGMTVHSGYCPDCGHSYCIGCENSCPKGL